MRYQGHCRNWDRTYGWIVYHDEHDRPKTVFVHHTAIQRVGWRELNPGDLVEFEIEESPQHGTHAVRVEVLEAAAA